MDESLRSQIDSNLSHLDALIRRGQRLRETLAENPSDPSALVANRAWQMDIGVAINQLSGGSKAHWLARAFSEAFLLRTASGQVIEAVAPAEIVERLIGVLDQAVLSLGRMGDGISATATAPAAPLPRRFEFVHNAELRPVLEQAYIDSRDALEQKQFGTALINSSGILEAIVTDALEFSGLDALAVIAELPGGKISEWSFDDRLTVAERAKIIRGGCARLPKIARRYREITDEDGNSQLTITEQDAKRTTQVLHVVMKDLDPGR
ncbi:MAG TPA: hypothetical protein VH161_09945 [Candidatus Acidoferrales bacterium]|nr:hypothetical protein [Candidatus Acidoferrales bacterium]